MKNVLLCSSDLLLVKNLYGMLRENGYAVDIVEHPALAVQKVMEAAYNVLIIDTEPFGLSSEDAVQIITTLKPDLLVFCLGSGCTHGSVRLIDSPLDIEAFQRTMQSLAA